MADFTCKVWVYCPYCPNYDAYQDITDQLEKVCSEQATSILELMCNDDGEIDDDEEGDGMIVECEDCKKEFIVDKMEY